MSTHERHLRKNIELLRIQEDIARRERKLLEWELHTIISARKDEPKTSCDPETP